jgi:predicted ATP-grasp superfamily ATP-dependent carboligase
VNSQVDRGHVLIVAQSGRELAAAARRSSYAPSVVDLYGDLDTQEIAAASCVLTEAEIHGPPLLRALAEMAQNRAPIGCVYGSGFEHRPDPLDAISQCYALLGNTATTVARAKQPFDFAKLCRALDVPHPDVSDCPPGGSWLVKQAGGAGGRHISPARRGVALAPGQYGQRHVGGRPVSALFLADGRHSLVLGFSEQWSDPCDGEPYRYGGAIRPAAVPDDIAHAIAGSVDRLTAALELVGLNSADCLVREDGFDLLEINPRPGASIGIFDPHGDLFRLHVEACQFRLPPAAPVCSGAAGAAVVYAPAPLTLPPGFCWPAWTADRQPPLQPVGRNAPLCTVLATAAEPASVRRLLDARRAEILLRSGVAR